MKCPVCGAYNKSDYNKCFRCGASLADAVASKDSRPLKKDQDTSKVELIPSESATVWNDYKKSRQQPFYIRKKDKEAPLLAIDDEEENVFIDESTPLKKRKRNEDKVRRLREGSEVNVVVPPKPKKEKKPKTKRKGLRWGRLVLSSVVIVAVLFGVIIGLVYTIRGISSGFSTIFEPRNPVINDGKPLVERLLIDGQTWHRITFYGKDGERILVQEPKRTLTIHDGKAELLLDDLSYIPDATDDDYDAESIAVSIQAIKVSKDGSETNIVVDPYEISVPLSPLKLIHPVEQSLAVEYSQVLVRLKVTPGSRVIVGEKNLTDLVDRDGYASTYIDLRSGQNDIPIIVETAKHRKNTYNLLVQHPDHDVEIWLEGPTSVHQYNDVKITGYVEPEATLYVNTERLAADISIEKQEKYDYFEFQYRLNNYGWNDIEIKATAPDGRTTTLIHRVERKPAEGWYTSRAHKLPPEEYDFLTSATHLRINQIYLCHGTVFKTIETDEATLYQFNVGTEDEVRYIILQHTGRHNQELELDTVYNAYAHVVGTYDNYPLLHAPFIYVDESATSADESSQIDETPAPDSSSEEN